MSPALSRMIDIEQAILNVSKEAGYRFGCFSLHRLICQLGLERASIPPNSSISLLVNQTSHIFGRYCWYRTRAARAESIVDAIETFSVNVTRVSACSRSEGGGKNELVLEDLINTVIG
jgi:hypothetical protein